jgi:peptidoglycan/LPS O-acetylase OafA/YrhL
MRQAIPGFNSIRAICALCVFFGHGSAPPEFNPFVQGSLLHALFHGIQRNMWVGPAAVIIFFVVSGFCIHYSYAGSIRPVALRDFYVRRFIRLCVPLAVALILTQVVGFSLESVIWSLYAEGVYYLLYPGLRKLMLISGHWKPLLIGATLAAGLVVASDPWAANYPSYGAFNWLLGLPCWLLGCHLAENISAIDTKSGPIKLSSIVFWRLGVFMVAGICSILRFHSPVGYPWTLTGFGFVVYLWLRQEVAYRRLYPAWGFMEWAGTWSYSLYLIHLPMAAFFDAGLAQRVAPKAVWIVKILMVVVAAVLFYLVVELPSHRWARGVFGKRRPPLPT